MLGYVLFIKEWLKERETLGQTIHIYHTNDLHSHFEMWPQISYYLKQQKIKHDTNGETCLLFDIGDHVDRFHPISEATSGKANIQLLNELNYDAVTIGNNEGITLSHDQLDTLYDEATFPVIVANLRKENGDRPKWTKPYEIITTEQGIKIGVIGVTVFYETFYRMLGWSILDPFDCIKQVLKEIRDYVDSVILLSHLGLSDDEIVARKFPEIDVIIGGHTHHVLQNGKVVNNTLLTGAGKYGQWIGHIKITLGEGEENEIQAELVDTNSLPQDKEASLHLQQLEKEAKSVLNEPVARLTKPLELNWFKDSSFSQLLAKALKEWCNSEASMVNAGVLLESLPKGIVTKGDIHRICPHPINPCLLTISGNQLKEVILQARTDKMEKLKLKGLGFRGKVMGRMIFDGIVVEGKKLEDGQFHVREVYVNGAPLDPNRTYRIATLDMFTLGPLYPELSHLNEKTYFMPEMLRDILEWKLKQS